jgi:hypothetical protein
MRYFLPVIILLFGVRAYSQKISGIVVDKTTRQPIAGALVSFYNLTVRAGGLGRFEMNVSHLNDSLRVSAFAYKTISVFITPANVTLVVELDPKITRLTEVTVHGNRDFKQDSLANRAAFAKQFNYRAPSIKDAFSDHPDKQPGELISINPLLLIAALTKKSSPEYKFQQQLMGDEHEQYVDEKFNRGNVTRITGLRGDTLATFMVQYRPGYQFALKATDYEIEVYIKNCYKKFEQEGFPASNPFEAKN